MGSGKNRREGGRSECDGERRWKGWMCRLGGPLGRWGMYVGRCGSGGKCVWLIQQEMGVGVGRQGCVVSIN